MNERRDHVTTTGKRLVATTEEEESSSAKYKLNAPGCSTEIENGRVQLSPAPSTSDTLYSAKASNLKGEVVRNTVWKDSFPVAF